MKNFLSVNLDFFGFLNSAICAVHCAVFPILISMGLMEGIFWVEHFWLEMLFLGLSIIFATFSLLKSYRIHGKKMALLLVAIGLIFLLIGMNIHGLIQIISMTTGGILIATAHIVNFNISKQLS